MAEYSVWELVKRMEEQKENDSAALGTLIATMLVNYGKNGRCRAGLVNEGMTPLAMLCVT